MSIHSLLESVGIDHDAPAESSARQCGSCGAQMDGSSNTCGSCGAGQQ